MANDTQVTIIGNLTAEPELRFTQAGVPVANFTIASTPRAFDKQANEWKDGEALFMRCSVWRDAAENVSASLTKGSRVIAQGNIVQRAFTDKDGNNRTSVEMQVLEVGPSLKYATAVPVKVQSGQGGQQAPPQGAPQGGNGYGAPQQGGYPPQGAPAPGWGAQQPPQQQGGYPPQGQPPAGDPWAGLQPNY